MVWAVWDGVGLATNRAYLGNLDAKTLLKNVLFFFFSREYGITGFCKPICSKKWFRSFRRLVFHAAVGFLCAFSARALVLCSVTSSPAGGCKRWLGASSCPPATATQPQMLCVSVSLRFGWFFPDIVEIGSFLWFRCTEWAFNGEVFYFLVSSETMMNLIVCCQQNILDTVIFLW